MVNAQSAADCGHSLTFAMRIAYRPTACTVVDVDNAAQKSTIKFEKMNIYVCTFVNRMYSLVLPVTA